MKIAYSDRRPDTLHGLDGIGPDGSGYSGIVATLLRCRAAMLFRGVSSPRRGIRHVFATDEQSVDSDPEAPAPHANFRTDRVLVTRPCPQERDDEAVHQALHKALHRRWFMQQGRRYSAHDVSILTVRSGRQRSTGSQEVMSPSPP